MREASAESEWERIEPRTLTLDGDRVVYRVAGQGPVLLLVHGLAGSAMTLRHVMAPLARHFTVIAPDLLGQGESDKPRAEYSLGAHVDRERGLATAQISCLIGNHAAQRAYEKAGFAVVEELRHAEFEAALGAPGFSRMTLALKE